MADVAYLPTMNQNTETTPNARVPSRIWIRDTRGRPSASLTLVVVAFFVVTLGYACSMLGQVGAVAFRPFEPAAVSAYLMPILALYFGRRWVDAKAAPVDSSTGAGS